VHYEYEVTYGSLSKVFLFSLPSSTSSSICGRMQSVTMSTVYACNENWSASIRFDYSPCVSLDITLVSFSHFSFIQWNSAISRTCYDAMCSYITPTTIPIENESWWKRWKKWKLPLKHAFRDEHGQKVSLCLRHAIDMNTAQSNCLHVLYDSCQCFTRTVAQVRFCVQLKIKHHFVKVSSALWGIDFTWVAKSV